MKRHGRRGNSMLEMAVSFSLLFSVFAGTFQFGYSFFVYNRLESAVRAGARYASLRAYDSASATPSGAFLSSVRNAVIYGNPAGGGQPVVPGLNASNVVLTVTMLDGVPHQMTVSLTNFRIDAVFKSFTLRGRPLVSFPFVGRYAGA